MTTPEDFQGLYNVVDGYVTGDRPQRFKIDASELDNLDDNPSDDALLNLYQRLAEEHMESVISAEVSKETEFLTWARAHLAHREEV